MQKDVNYALLIVILGLLLAIVGISIYYQNTYRWLSDEYDASQKQLEERVNELTAKEQSLNQTLARLNKTERDQSVLREKYTGLESEKDVIYKDLLSTRAQRDSLDQNLTKYRIRRAALVNETEDLRDAINALDSKIEGNETLKASLGVDINWALERMDKIEQEMTLLQALP